MADSKGERQGELPGLGHILQTDEKKGENTVSSSTSMETKCERREEDQETESLPQTYCASPPIVPPTSHLGAENLSQTGISTVYATIAPPSYADSVVPGTYAVAVQRSYLNNDTSVSTTDTTPEQIAYVSGSMPLASVSSTVMAHADYIIASEPIDFRRPNVSHANEVSRVQAADRSDTGRSSTPLIVSTSSINIPHSGDVTRETVPHIENLSRVNLPQTAGVARIKITDDDIHRGIIHTSSVNRMSAPHMSEVSRMSASETVEVSAMSVPASVEGGRIDEPIVGNVSILESSEVIQRSTPVTDDVARRNLPMTVTRGSSHDNYQVDRRSMSNISGVSALETVDIGSMHPHECEKIWINVPVSGHSAHFLDVGKVNTPGTNKGSRMVVPVTSNTVTCPESSAAEGITAPEMGNVRTVVMSHIDDFSRMSVSHTGEIISTSQSGHGGRIDATVPQTTGMHIMDIKYNDLKARNNIGDMSRNSTLQTHAVYSCEDDRVSISHMQESSEMSAQHTVDTKPIILPQTGDVSIVTYPHTGEGVSAMAVPQTGNISMVILPQTSDVGHMSTAQGDVRRIDLFPADDSNSTEIQSADGSRMNIHQSGNVIRISLPAPGDVSRMHIPQVDGSLLQVQQADVRMILPQTSDVRSVEVDDKVDVGKMIALQSRAVSAGDMQQKSDMNRMISYQSGSISSARGSRTGDANTVETQQVYDARTNQAGDICAVKRQQVYDVTRTRVSQDGDNSALDRQMYPVARTSVSQSGDIGVADPLGMYEITRTNVPQAGDIGSADRQQNYNVKTRMTQAGNTSTADRQQIYDVVKTRTAQAGSGISNTSDRQLVHSVARTDAPQAGDTGLAERQQMYGIVRTRVTQADDINAVDRQQIYDVARGDLSQTGDLRAFEVTGSHRMSAPHTDDVNMIKMQQASDLKMSSAVYTDTSMMTLPQTSGVRALTVSCTEDAVEASSHSQSLPFEVSRVNVSEQPHPEYSNMRVMVEAAEIISRRSVPADEINMRLMAETADYVSRKRNVSQTSVINSTGSIQQTQDISAKVIAGTTDGSAVQTPQNDVPSEVSKNTNTVENLVHIKPAYQNKTVTPRNVLTHDNGSTDMMGTSLKKLGTAASSGQKTVTEKGKERAGAKNDKGKQIEQQLESGFRTEFLKSQSYVRWKDIGSSQGLQNDEEIACFLMKYYDNTSGLFPSGRVTCNTCQRQLSVSCTHCPQKTAGDIKDARTDKKKEKKASDDRTKLWKLIVEASSSEKGEEKGKEDKTEKRHRRKPRQTRRVLRRRVIVSPSRSSDDDSHDEQDTSTCTEESPLPTKVVFEEEQKSTPTPMVTRKRGRPSNDSYQQASTLECSGCQRKFHTAIGLDQHIKRKRCKASKAVVPVSDKKEAEKNTDKTVAPFQFKCTDCNKEYRSKQGLMLHRTSKHGEVDEKLQLELPEVDDGEDTDEYVPYPKDKASTAFECTDCHKKYRSKQGLLMHKASKHSQVPEKKIKLEDEEDDQEDPDMNKSHKDSEAKNLLSFECKECSKKYLSRPGYVLHMKTKHSPQVFLECQECHGKFKTKLELRIHIHREHSKNRIVLFCPYCPLTFDGRDALKIHMDESHKTCRRVLFDCFACDLQFSSRIERKRHIQSEHKGKDTSLTCHYCGSWFATRYEYDQHEKEGHPEQTQEWLCAICGDSFPTRYLLQRHALTHKEKVHCKLCNKYITEPCFEDHMKRHYGNKTWKCELCSKSFIRKAELQQHTLVHKDERPFCCELCGMRYREKSRLNSHMRTHTGVKPYRCHQCEKCFTRSRELKNHMRIHTGEKPFACTVCGRKFASSGNLSAHRRKVHKLEPIPHGQQSRKHTLEESIKPENKLPSQPPLVAPPTSHESPVAAHSSVPLEIPVAHSAASLEIPADHSSGSLEAPVAHSTGLTLQVPMAHQAPMAHQDQAVVYQQHLIPKYEPLVTQPEHYIPQPVIQQPQSSSLAIYWPNASYGEES